MKKKCALITGASGGIGSSIALRLARDGFAVAACYRSDEAGIASLAAEFDVIGAEYKIYRADVADYSQMNTVFADATEEFGGVSVLVNNAGVAQQKLFTDLTDEDWHRMMGVDLDGVFYACRAVLPGMIRQKYGRILLVSSMWGQTGGSCEVHYSAAKAGVIGLTKALAKEEGPSGITVNCVAPGVIETDMMGSFTAEDKAALAEETPVERLGTPEEVARTLVFLAGQVLGVNGGIVI